MILHKTLSAKEILMAVAGYIANAPDLNLSEDAEITCKFVEDDDENLMMEVYIVDNARDGNQTVH